MRRDKIKKAFNFREIKMTEQTQKPGRKIVQICAIPGTEYSHCCIYVLCDDGSLWAAVNAGEWTKLPPIPQDDAS